MQKMLKAARGRVIESSVRSSIAARARPRGRAASARPARTPRSERAALDGPTAGSARACPRPRHRRPLRRHDVLLHAIIDSSRHLGRQPGGKRCMNSLPGASAASNDPGAATLRGCASVRASERRRDGDERDHAVIFGDCGSSVRVISPPMLCATTATARRPHCGADLRDAMSRESRRCSRCDATSTGSRSGSD